MIAKGRLVTGLGLSLVAFVSAGPLRAELNVFACEPEWAALAIEIGGDGTLYLPSHLDAQLGPVLRLAGQPAQIYGRFAGLRRWDGSERVEYPIS